MAWPPKIAHAKPHELMSPFDSWYYKAVAKDKTDFPLATELLYGICGNDPHKFDRANEMLEEAFNAGVKHGKKSK